VWGASPGAGSAFIGRRRGGGGPSAVNGRLEEASMAGLKTPVSWIEEGEKWRRLMGELKGNRCGFFFLFRWSVGATGEAVRGRRRRRRARPASVREEEEDAVRGGLGRPKGQGRGGGGAGRLGRGGLPGRKVGRAES
jgi:hypothetical protein